VFVCRENAERFIEVLRGDDPELAKPLRIRGARARGGRVELAAWAASRRCSASQTKARTSLVDLDIEAYARRHPTFVGVALPAMLARIARPGVIADLGCGDGATIAALNAAGLLGPTTFAVDLSETRVRNAERIAPRVSGIVSDAAVTGLAEASVDGVVCSQVIEHVPDDRAVACEIARILKPGGWWYVSSVARRRRSWWLYQVDGERRLDPTHIREYASIREFVNVLQLGGLQETQVEERRIFFPVGELAARLLRRDTPLPLPRWVAVSPPGFRFVEAAGSVPI
jgi:2-polyprenyl-3-methyl-5-hydroxy-6-metoxy-1,4-benzoquinol methylase